MQSEIAVAVAAALRATLSSGSPAGPATPAALELYLQGRFFHRRRAPGDTSRAEDYYRRALTIDPAYGRAWAALAGTYLVQVFEERKDTPAMRAAWKEAVERALEHAPNLAETHLRASAYYWHVRDDERWREHHARAGALGPEDPLVLSISAGIDLFNGRRELAVDQYRRAVELNPLSASDRSNLAQFLASTGRFAEALAEARHALNLNPAAAPELEIIMGYLFILQKRWEEALAAVERWPDGPHRDAGLGMLHHALGDGARADAALAALTARAQVHESAAMTLRLAEVQAFRGRLDESFRWLATGRDSVRGEPRWKRAERITNVQLSPFLIPLRDDPRWESIVAWER